MQGTMAMLATGSLLAALGLLAGCQVSQTAAGGSSPNGGGGGGGATGDGGAADAATGTNCTIQTTSGTMLCEETSLCPKLSVNQTTFDQCGFLVNGDKLDLECECSGYLCNAGPTPTCAAAATILEQQTSVSVCNQLSAGGCQFEGLSGGSGSGSSACNTACSSQCVGDPVCLTGCGC